jgi:hypothetical protein
MNGAITKPKPTFELHLGNASIFDDGSQDFHFMDRPETNKGKKESSADVNRDQIQTSLTKTGGFPIRPKKGETWYSRKQGYILYRLVSNHHAPYIIQYIRCNFLINGCKGAMQVFFFSKKSIVP